MVDAVPGTEHLNSTFEKAQSRKIFAICEIFVDLYESADYNSS